MKAIEDGEIEEMRLDARAGATAMRAFLTYQGDNPGYEKKAKIGAVFVNAYIRARATEANRMLAEVASTRLGLELAEGATGPRLLKQA